MSESEILSTCSQIKKLKSEESSSVNVGSTTLSLSERSVGIYLVSLCFKLMVTQLAAKEKQRTNVLDSSQPSQ